MDALERVLDRRSKALTLLHPISSLRRALKVRPALDAQLKFQSYPPWPSDVVAKLLQLPPGFIRTDDPDAETVDWLFRRALLMQPAQACLIGAGGCAVVLAIAMKRLTDALGGPLLHLVPPAGERHDTQALLNAIGLGEYVVNSKPERRERTLLVLAADRQTDLEQGFALAKDAAKDSELVLARALVPAQQRLLEQLSQAQLLQSPEYVAVGRGIVVAGLGSH